MTFADRAQTEAARRYRSPASHDHFMEGAEYGFPEGRADALADPTDEEVMDAARAAHAELEPGVSWELLAGIDRVPWELAARAAVAAFLAARRGSE